MSGPQYRSAWGSDAGGVGPQPKEVMPPVQVCAAQPERAVPVPGLPVAPPPASAATLAAQLATALAAERHTPWESWEALARRAGFPRSTLDRVRAGQGCTVGTADKLAELFGWTITLTRKE